MLNIEEAQQLMEDLIKLRTIAQETNKPEDITQFRKQEKLCVEKFTYLVTMKTAKYRAFSNYEDLNQEGYEALIKGMKNYNPKKGNAFWWFHRYIDTRVSRSANLHTTIRFPLKVAREVVPHKESIMPVITDDRNIPDMELESIEDMKMLTSAYEKISDTQKEIIDLAFGLDLDKPMSINKICQKLDISRSSCLKSIKTALVTMRENIK